MTTESPFMQIASKYRRAVNVILKEGKTSRPLRQGDEFKATPRHTVVVATVCNTLGGWMGLPDEVQENLNVTAILHDADKRLELRPDEFSAQEKSDLQERIASFNPDPTLLAVTKEGFVELNKDKVDEMSLPQMILYYADMIVSWSNIVTFKERLEESKTRRQEVPAEFFEIEYKFGSAIEKGIFDRLPAKQKEEAGTPENLPNYLKQMLS